MDRRREDAEKTDAREWKKYVREADERLLKAETVIGVLSCLLLFAILFIAAYAELPTWLRLALIAFGLAVFLVCAAYALRIEQAAGCYECAKCGHRYVPKYGSVFWAMHVGRTRYMKCPRCGKRSWQKKVIGSGPELAPDREPE